MSHETLQALYALDVAEVGEDEAAKRWEYWSGTMWRVNKDASDSIVKPSWADSISYRRKPGIPWPKVMMQVSDEKPYRWLAKVQVQNGFKERYASCSSTYHDCEQIPLYKHPQQPSTMGMTYEDPPNTNS